MLSDRNKTHPIVAFYFCLLHSLPPNSGSPSGALLLSRHPSSTDGRAAWPTSKPLILCQSVNLPCWSRRATSHIPIPRSDSDRRRFITSSLPAPWEVRLPPSCHVRAAAFLPKANPGNCSRATAKMPSLDPSELNQVIAVLGGFMVLYGFISVPIKQIWYLGEACTCSPFTRSSPRALLLCPTSNMENCDQCRPSPWASFSDQWQGNS
jgi:hypothetical protein